MMFERFTTDARRVVVDAQTHARRLGHRSIGSEHLLLALVAGHSETAGVLRDMGLTAEVVEAAIVKFLTAPDQGPDRDALASIGIDLDHVVQRAEEAFGANALHRPHARTSRRRWGRRRSRCDTPRSGHIPFTPRAKKCLELSLREALALRHRHIGAEHIALGIVRANDGLASKILESLGVSPAQVRNEILRRQRLAG